MTVPTIIPQKPATYSQQDYVRWQIVGGNVNKDEFDYFLAVARHLGLDPLRRQIYCVKRGQRAVVQTGIDGYRAIASRTGMLAGIDDAEYGPEDDKGHPAWARVTVYRLVKGHRYAFTATARWKEYKPDASPMWDRMPFLMLAKCAEALALRKAFPAELSGIYTDAEMEQADNAPTLGTQILEQAATQEEAQEPQTDVILARANDLRNRAALVGWIGTAYSELVCQATHKTAKQLHAQGKPTSSDLDKLEKRIILLEKAAKAEAEKADDAALKVVDAEPEQEPEVA